MSKIFRFGVSLPKELIEEFDKLIKNKKYNNRSEALRDMIRQELIKKEWSENKEVVGAITLIYNHHKREVVNKVLDIQHNFQKEIISTQHIHLDHDNCLEIVAVKGLPQLIIKLTDTLKSLKGIKHSTLSMSSTGTNLQ
jgi:CopG family nickel-responsive transcriptional regulator